MLRHHGEYNVVQFLLFHEPIEGIDDFLYSDGGENYRHDVGNGPATTLRWQCLIGLCVPVSYLLGELILPKAKEKTN